MLCGYKLGKTDNFHYLSLKRYAALMYTSRCFQRIKTLSRKIKIEKKQEQETFIFDREF